jgi:pimeloyl-ACP methyl ester carboxylesterase
MLGAANTCRHVLQRWVVAVAIISLVAGAALSHRIEPGVRFEKVMLTTNTPALRLFPATPGPHPKALLAHGGCGSKEMLFRFGEAFAAAGFDCYSVDQAGQGESPQPFSITNLLLNIQESDRALAGVDVFIGHSLGGAAGAWSVHDFGFQPKFFIGLEAQTDMGERRPPLLLLMARFGEFRPLMATWLKAQTNEQVAFSPWFEHITAAYAPTLVNAGVKAVCTAFGNPVPAAPTAWRWRLVGLLLGITGALGLMFYLPEVHPSLARIRRFIVPGVLLFALVLTLWPWVGVNPQLRRIPAQLVVLCVEWLALVGASSLRMPRWQSPGSPLVAGRGEMAILQWPSLRVIPSGNSYRYSIEERVPYMIAPLMPGLASVNNRTVIRGARILQVNTGVTDEPTNDRV